MATPFVNGWDFVQVLGEGAYGEVKLAVNKESGEEVAVKLVDHTKSATIANNIRKEIIINKMLQHDNIIRYLGHRTDPDKEYLFLEYACGGELFDRIEPDAGMVPRDAQRYFKHLLAGVEYLHQRGVAHRDIKPENLLLDARDILKISDFGLATLFRHQGVERQLETCCGTLPYLAPEIVTRGKYHAQPVDIWSCGIVLVALLAGELPWDEPVYECDEYEAWEDCKVTTSPWNKIDNIAFSLIRKILTENPQKRFKMAALKKHPWLSIDFSNQLQCKSNKKVKISADDIIQTQPDPHSHHDSSTDNTGLPVQNPYSFSQPLNIDNLLLGSQLQASANYADSSLPRLVRRMTRFFVNTDTTMTMTHLTNVVNDFKYAIKKSSPGQLTISTVDRRKSTLVFKATVIDMAGNVLLDFRLSKGDGLEFKKCFLKIKNNLSSIVNTALMGYNWSHLGSTNDRNEEKKELNSDGATKREGVDESASMDGGVGNG